MNISLNAILRVLKVSERIKQENLFEHGMSTLNLERNLQRLFVMAPTGSSVLEIIIESMISYPLFQKQDPLFSQWKDAV